MQERSGVITFQGNGLTLLGPELKVGDPAPEATVLGNDLSEVTISSMRGSVAVLVAVPSLDTDVCTIETQTFNEEAAKLGDNVKVQIISMDLPFAQKRWVDEHETYKVTTYSDHRDASFGMAYGALIKELRLLTRVVYVVDTMGTLAYQQFVPEVTHEPDYDAVLDAVKKLDVR